MSDYRSLFKHAGNYLIANLATKALAFVSIPVYTRILTVEDYGVVSVFMSMVGIVSVFLTLSTESAIGRYYYDAKDIEDFKRFVGTSIRLTSSIMIVMSLLFIICLSLISNSISLSPRLTLCLIPVAIFHVTNSVFTQIYNPMMQSKKIAIVSSVQAYTAFALSVVCIMLVKSEKYYGYVYGNILAMVLLGSYMVSQVKPYFTNCFDRKYVSYILKYCLPYIPDTLSGIAIAHFSKIYMGSNQGFAMAGSYGFVVNLATLMAIVIQITNNAWIPYYFRYMNVNDKRSIDNDLNLIWRITLIAAIALSFFGKELAIILARKDFLSMLPIFPLLVSGYVFHQWAYVYLRGVAYAKRMMWNTYSYMFSGIILVVLNIILVPRYQGWGAASATLISYASLFLFAFVANKLFVKQYAPALRKSIKPFVAYCLFLTLAICLYNSDVNWYIELFIKIIAFLFFSMLLLLKYVNKIKLLIKKL